MHFFTVKELKGSRKRSRRQEEFPDGL